MRPWEDYISDARTALESSGNYDEQLGADWKWHPTDSTQSLKLGLAQKYMDMDYNAEQAELAFQREQSLINEQNEYNSPANQMARYMEAGLNPSVIYGQISSGNQSNVAQYAPQRAEQADLKVTSRQEKFNRTLAVINTIFDAIGKSAQIAQQVEGVRNQSLQNQIMQIQMPAIENESLARSMEAFSRGWLFDENTDRTSPEYERMMKMLYPNFYRADYQDWWNTSIAPLYKNLESGKVDIQGLQKWMLEYQKSMMDSMPPALKQWMPMLMPFLQAMMRL